MCGRFTFATAQAALVELLGLDQLPELRPRYNIAPTQDVPVVRMVAEGEQRRRVLHLLHWGLVPSWAADPTVGNRMINARCETAAVKPAYRAAFRRRRCLVLADGFYEWKSLGRSSRQPHLIRMRDGRPFAFAGLWERWRRGEEQALESCTLLTCDSNELVAPIHKRMPVILAPEDYDRWLDPELQDPTALASLLRPYPAGEMTAFVVSPRVNSPALDDPACVEPVGVEQAPQTELPLPGPPATGEE